MALMSLLGVITFTLLASAISFVDGAPQRTVIFNEDGAIDELIAYLMFAAEDSAGALNLLGEVMTNADSVLPSNMEVAGRLHNLSIGPSGRVIPLVLSNSRGFNPFPWSYRTSTPSVMNYTSIANVKSTVSPPYTNAEEWIRYVLSQQPDRSVTYVEMSAMTTLYDALAPTPELLVKIKDIVWMGGAINDAGNLEMPMFPFPPWNTKAEWNVFFDPYAVEWLFSAPQLANVPIYLFPLDLSNQAPITDYFIHKLQDVAHQTPLASFAYESYSYAKRTQEFYRLWDTAAAAGYLRPQLFLPPKVLNLSVITDYFPNQGALVRSETLSPTACAVSSNSHGYGYIPSRDPYVERSHKVPPCARPAQREVHVYFNFTDVHLFYDYVVEVLSTPAL